MLFKRRGPGQKPHQFHPHEPSLPIFKVSTASVVFTLSVLTAIILFLVIACNMSFVESLRNGSPLASGSQRYYLIVANVLFPGCWVLAAWKIYCDYRTIITEKYVFQPWFFKSTLIYWDEVTNVELIGYGLHVRSPHGHIILTPAIYKKPDAVVYAVKNLAEKDKSQG